MYFISFEKHQKIYLVSNTVPFNNHQALPMVTIIVGKVVPNSNTADIITCCDGADDPRRVQFQLNNLTPGLPR